MADPALVEESKQTEKFPDCESCSQKNAGIFYCDKLPEQCQNAQKYCCEDCNCEETIHSHKLKSTKKITNDFRDVGIREWNELRESCINLWKEAEPKEMVI